MKNNVQIKNKISGEILEFKSLDTALRTLTGVDSKGPKFNQILLTKPGKMTYKDAEKTITLNGYEVVQRAKAEWKKKGEVTVKLEAESDKKINKMLEDSIKHEESKKEDKTFIKHFQFGKLLALIAARVNALLVGPAGSGKTMSAEAVAHELGLPYYSMSVGMQTTKTEFFGYMDAQGRYVRSLFREAFEFGGVFLIDELDAGNANVMTAMNQALANQICAFPDGMVPKHENFVIISSANTFGTGANREYVGRNQLDAATLDRFGVINWNYDVEMEKKLVSNKGWLELVWTCRRNADKYKIRTVVSPRASINGALLIDKKMPVRDVMEITLRKGLNDTEWQKLIEGVKPEAAVPPVPPTPKPEAKKSDKKQEGEKQEGNNGPNDKAQSQEQNGPKDENKGDSNEKSGQDTPKNEQNGNEQEQKDQSETPSQPSGNGSTDSQKEVSDYEKMAVEEPAKLKQIADSDNETFERMKAEHQQVVQDRVSKGLPAKLSADQIKAAIERARVKEVKRFGRGNSWSGSDF